MNGAELLAQARFGGPVVDHSRDHENDSNSAGDSGSTQFRAGVAKEAVSGPSKFRHSLTDGRNIAIADGCYGGRAILGFRISPRTTHRATSLLPFSPAFVFHLRLGEDVR
jgi:hypothetical protein